MFIEPESSQSVSDRIMKKLEAIGLTANNSGSKIRTIVDAFLSERIEIMRDIRYVSSKSFLSTADGAYLDLIGGDLYGINRLPITPASVTEVDGNIMIFSTNGPLSTYLPVDTGGYYVPVGMQLIDKTGEVIFSTDKKIYIENAATQTFVSATANTSGIFSNIAPGGLVTTDRTGISVVNLSAIANGREEESDENYRYRISKAYVASELNNINAIRLASLSVPGVAEVIIRNFAYGPGTVQVLVLPEGNSVSNSVLSQVKFNIDAVKPKETAIYVDVPDYISVSVAYAFFGRVLNDIERSLLVSQIKNNVSNLIANTRGGSTFNPSDIILSSLEGIPGIVGRVEKLCVNGVPQNNKIYNLGIDEILILDITEQEPIKVYA